jgi:DNA-binding NtrC family response regulator
MTVLLIEDDTNDAALMKQACERRAISVAHATTKRAALAALDAAMFDVVILDMHLPDSADAVELFCAVRERARGAAVVPFTGQNRPGLDDALTNAGVAGLSMKPGDGGTWDDCLSGILLAVERHYAAGGAPAIEQIAAEVEKIMRALKADTRAEQDRNGDENGDSRG